MTKRDTKTILYSLIVSMTVGTFFIGFSYIHAQWQPPTAPAPGDNVDAPVNVTNQPQFKPAPLGARVLSTPYGAADRRALGANAWTLMSGAADGSGGGNSQLRTNSTDGRTIDSDGFATRIFDQASNNILRFQNSGTTALNAGDTINWESSFNIFDQGRVGANLYCDINGNNCVDFSQGLQREVNRYHYWRQGIDRDSGDISRDRTTTTVTIPNPSSGPPYDTCLISRMGSVVTDASSNPNEPRGFIHSSDREITPSDWNNRLRRDGGVNSNPNTPPRAHSSTVAVTPMARDNAGCSIYRSQSRGGWALQLTMTDSNYIGICVATCTRVQLDFQQ